MNLKKGINMEKQNIFKKIWNSIKFFFSTLVGYQTNKLLLRIQIDQKDLMELLRSEFIKIRELQIKQILAVDRILNKYYFPVLINNKGVMLNLSQHRELRSEISYNAENDSLDARLFISKNIFFFFFLDLDESYNDHPAKPLFEYAAGRFRKRDRDFMTLLERTFLINLIHQSFTKYVLHNQDIREILGITLLEISKPDYIRINKLKDFDIQKGPVKR